MNRVAGVLLVVVLSGASPFTEAAPPATIPNKLRVPIDVDFQRTPLQLAVKEIAQKTGVTFHIDREALKAEGLTQNYPLTLKLSETPADRILLEIEGKLSFARLRFRIDEPGRAVIVTAGPEL